MHWVLAANGHAPLKNIINHLGQVDCWVGVDGGCRILEALQVLPQFIIGDMDSIPQTLLHKYQEHNIPIIVHPRVKDETDLELALNMALDSGAQQITLVGAIGNRLDHTLANILLLSRCLENNVSARIVDNQQSIYLVDRQLELKGQPGDLFSLIPLKDALKGVTLRGLEYPLANAALAFGSPQGLSNVFSHAQVMIQIQKGLALVIHQYF